ncbi:RNA polymerase sigma factor (sigma-70 family) [Pseudogracilibacillus auburnensis]|uniref:RNA polymerase sigma factor (Sigma-70 family) n=2 Tax=Pseudogracilibacillus auburnensis TaxID=1494959 RepID=A0A2V3VUM6_9BACI|nr:RNA polymerase sigma factor (sigma-70 family) [Pseudogracilibacillus auburnensis]
MKLYLALKRQPDRTLTKRFFYQVARNTWIDQLRKQKVTTESFEENKYPGNDHEDFFQICESLEILAEYLTVKQFVIVLFMDVFQFTAQETADMISDTQANMYTILHRSRKKLKKCIDLATDPKSAFEPLMTKVTRFLGTEHT